MNIWDKINLKEIKETNKIINSINKNENKNEIKNETGCKTKDWYEKTPCEDDINDFTIIEKPKKNIVNDNTISKDNNDGYNNFNIDTMKKISHFSLKNPATEIKKIIILKDGRILISSEYNFYIYRLEEDYNDICNIFCIKNIIDIVQLEDENLLISEDKLKIYQLEEKEIKLIKEKKINLYNARFYYLSNKILLFMKLEIQIFLHIHIKIMI